MLEVEFVKSRAVVKKCAPHQADFLEGPYAAIDGHEITGPIGERGMQLFNARELFVLVQCIKDGDPWLSKA